MKSNGQTQRLPMQKGTKKWGQRVLLTECENLSKELGVRDVTKGFHHKETIKEEIRKGNDKEIKSNQQTKSHRQMER